MPLDDLVDDAIAAAGATSAAAARRRSAIAGVDPRRRRDAAAPGARQPAAERGALRARQRADPRRGAAVTAGVEIRVIDHGPGVPEPERLRIFEPYKRLATRRPRRGLGARPGDLARLRGRARRHARRRDDARRRRHLRRDAAGRRRTARWRVRSRSCSSTTSRPILRALQTALESHDYTSPAVTSGEQAVARDRVAGTGPGAARPRAPGIDGFEVIRRIRTFAPTLPIVVVSAHGDDASKVRALDHGADDYVSKPSPSPSCWPGCGPRCATASARAARGDRDRARTIPIDLLRREAAPATGR